MQEEIESETSKYMTWSTELDKQKATVFPITTDLQYRFQKRDKLPFFSKGKYSWLRTVFLYSFFRLVISELVRGDG